MTDRTIQGDKTLNSGKSLIVYTKISKLDYSFVFSIKKETTPTLTFIYSFFQLIPFMRISTELSTSIGDQSHIMGHTNVQAYQY